VSGFQEIQRKLDELQALLDEEQAQVRVALGHEPGAVEESISFGDTAELDLEFPALGDTVVLEDVLLYLSSNGK
jgi:hypothetical protein